MRLASPLQAASALVLCFTPILASSASANDGLTHKHEAGRCALRGQCGKQSLFGGELPCPDNGHASTPDDDLRKQLVAVCGNEWAESDVCCTADQVDVLKSNLNRAGSIIGACPACKKNFNHLFCTFTCSPDQSLFVNVTATAPKGDKLLVTELDQLWSDDHGRAFYDSCKDVKFGGTNGRAMDLIGGGARNFTQFLKFLGDKKFGGSPFQINFPRPNDGFTGMNPRDDEPVACNTTDQNYHCSCVDCAGSCPALPEITESSRCYVGILPCLSFAVIVVYSVFILLLVTAVTGHVAYMKHSKSRNERLRLLQDSAQSDDEDEGDLIHHGGLMERPRRHYRLNTWCDRLFSKLGRTCARYPAITIVSSVIIVGFLSIGWIRFEVERDPVRLWVAPESDAAQEKHFFDQNFGPFFRAEQIFLVNDTDPSGPGPVLSYDTLKWWFEIESDIRHLRSREGYHLDDVCFKPTGDACVVQSVSGYFEDPTDFEPDFWDGRIELCSKSPVQCLPAFQQPLEPKYVFGGWNESVLDARALVITYVVNNYNPGDSGLEKAEDFEESLKLKLLDVQQEAEDRGLRLSFSTGVSLEEELNKSSNTDAKIVVISYIIMFIYASLTLGGSTLAAGTILRNPKVALVQSKFSLGVVGIVIVLMSVSASVGLFSAAGVKVTLIIAEVIPFLVLAIGVDNIFLIVHEFERVNLSHPGSLVEERVARALGRIGPSILLSATTETIAFALGAAVGMPAVKNFAAYAAGAVVVNALLQVTMFVSVLALNQKRVEAHRVDCLPCLSLRQDDGSYYGRGVALETEEDGFLTGFIRKYYAPALLGKKTKVLLITLFLTIFTAAIALFPRMELGLDQRTAIPRDSYLIPYFNDIYQYFDSGPPVYFVTRGLNATDRHSQQQLCSRFTTCEEFSLTSILEQERKRSDVSYISDATASWLDDFFLWLSPQNSECCVIDHGKFKGDACFEHRDPPWNITLAGMPEGNEFLYWLHQWITAPTTEQCPLAGQAAYGQAISIDDSQITIPGSHFRTSHTPLRSTDDFIESYAAARRIAKDISERTGIDVFPYSEFYIFFDQYATIRQLAGTLIGAALGMILVLTTLLLGSIRTGLVVTLTVAMAVADIVGTMVLVGVSLNALSLVNMVICVGISVEFCAHVARAFAFPSMPILQRVQNKYRGRDARAWAALVNVGGSVFSGITITKLLGVAVLAWTRSKIFEIYYFRVWLTLIVWAALHALVFLPIALSLFGGEGYLDADNDGGLEQDLASRRYRALLPDDEYDSDEDL